MRHFCKIDAIPILVSNLPIRMAIHLRGPSPNGKYGDCVNDFTFRLFRENRDGSNFSGFGKYFGSRCSENTGINTGVPFSIVISEPGTLYAFVHFRLSTGATGYFRSVSTKQNKKTKLNVCVENKNSKTYRRCSSPNT